MSSQARGATLRRGWTPEASGRRLASAPAELRRDVPDDAFQQVRVVVDAELVRDRQQQCVRSGDRLVPGEILDELVDLPGVRLAESGCAAIDEPDLVGTPRLRAEVRMVGAVDDREDAAADRYPRLALVAGFLPCVP